MTIKTLLALVLTFLLGPGAGHLYLRQYKRGVLFIGATLLCAVVIAFLAVKTLPPTLTGSVPAQLYQQFSMQHPDSMFYFDMIIAAIWAYAFVDAFFLSRTNLETTPHEDTL